MESFINNNLKQYYRGYTIERKQNQQNYSINGVGTTYISVQQCKNHIDEKLKTPKHKFGVSPEMLRDGRA